MAHPPHRSGRAPRDRGAQAVQYAGLIVLGAAILATIAVAVSGGDLTRSVSSGVCRILGGSDCGSPDPRGQDQEGDRSDGNASRGTPEPGGGGTDPEEKHGGDPPTKKELEDVEDEADEIRDYLDEKWYNPGDWFGGPDHPKDIMEGMSPDELQALYWSLSEDEIRQLLEDEDIRDLTLKNANAATIDRLTAIDPEHMEPDYGDVEAKKDAKKNKNERYEPEWGESDSSLYGSDGKVDSDDIGQGRLGDCWWMAGMGAVANKDPEAIKKMIKDNGNGSYTVTFGDGEEVTVTDDIVIDKETGAPMFADGDKALWPAILEKAYAEREGGFGDIEGGFGDDAMETLTGEDADSHDSEDVSEQELKDWVDGDTAVTVSTKPEGEGEGPLYENEELVEGHEYIVKGVKDGKVELQNPWGTDHATLTMDQYNTYMRDTMTLPTG